MDKLFIFLALTFLFSLSLSSSSYLVQDIKEPQKIVKRENVMKPVVFTISKNVEYVKIYAGYIDFGKTGDVNNLLAFDPSYSKEVSINITPDSSRFYLYVKKGKNFTDIDGKGFYLKYELAGFHCRYGVVCNGIDGELFEFYY